VSPIEPETDITDALEDLLTGDPPEGTTTLWAITDAAASPDGWYISLANLASVPEPYDDWSVMEDSTWLGSAECIEDGTWACEYYDPDLPEGGGGLIFPWRSGEVAIYGISGVHSGGWFTEYAVDFFPTTNETYAAEAGTVTWVCGVGTYNTGAIINGNSGDLLYLHLDINTPIEVGDYYRQGDLVGSLVRGSFNDLCGQANQQATSAHVHFGFDADAYFSIGGCVLNISTEIFDCNGDLIGITEVLGNNGANPDIPNPPGPTGTGGANLWDSVVGAFVSVIRDGLKETFKNYMIAHDNRITYFIRQAAVILVILWSFVANIIFGPLSITTIPMALALGLVITFELVFFAFELAKPLIRIGGLVIKAIV